MKQSPIHLALIIDSLKYGGAQRQFVELIKGLHAKNKYDIHVIVLGNENSVYVEIIESLGIKIKYFLRNYKYDLFGPLSKLIQYINKQNIELVHTFMNMGSLFGSLAAKLTRKPVVCSTIRDAMYNNAKEKRLQVLLSYIANIYVANSWAGFQNRFSIIKPHYRVVYNGIDFSRFQLNINTQALKKDIGLENFYPIIGSVASLSIRKDHRTLIEGFNALLQSFPNAALLLVGDGDQRVHLERLCKELNLNDSVFFVGYRKDVEKFYHLMDIHILLTNIHAHLEGISNSIIEAMACMVPVIATRGGGTSELIDHNMNGLLIEPFNSESLIKYMVALLSDRYMAKKITHAALCKIQKKLNMSRYIQDYEKIYNELLA